MDLSLSHGVNRQSQINLTYQLASCARCPKQFTPVSQTFKLKKKKKKKKKKNTHTRTKTTLDILYFVRFLNTL